MSPSDDPFPSGFDTFRIAKYLVAELTGFETGLKLIRESWTVNHKFGTKKSSTR